MTEMKNITIGNPLIQLESVDSTNIYAAQLLRSTQVKEGTVILAGHQTHGKGQGGNSWVSDAGCNLLLSVVLRPEFLQAERQFYLSMCVSNALLDFLLPFAQPVTIKWPNDILLRGQKVAGILIENSILDRNLRTSVVGIGVNVNQREFPPGIPNPASLRNAVGRDFDIPDMLAGLLHSLNGHIALLYSERFPEIKTRYLNNLLGLNKWATYSDSSGTFEGRIIDVAESGELMVLRHDGTLRHYGFKEITFIT
jgi:BirA family transcriptional regulator, biotin operon repressor / biotin---[acetyl-CoA-carboxylase] ligase